MESPHRRGSAKGIPSLPSSKAPVVWGGVGGSLTIQKRVRYGLDGETKMTVDIHSDVRQPGVRGHGRCFNSTGSPL